MALKLTSPPASEPVTLAEAKAHLRLEHPLDDVTVTSLIVAAREYVEEYLWRALISQTWDLTIDAFPVFGGDIPLAKGDVQSVTHVRYDDPAGVEQTLASSKYIVDGYPPPRLVLRRAETGWPETTEDALAVRIRFVAGYGATAAAVPQAIKQAILLLVSQLYEHRTPEVTGAVIGQVKFAFEALLSPYRLNEIG